MARTNQEAHQLSQELWAARDVAGWCALFRADGSRYIDPVFGEYRGRDRIERWLVEVMGRAGRWRSNDLVQPFFDGVFAAGESELEIPLPRGPFVLPFAWVERYEDGFIVYRRDYYDTHELRESVAASALRRPGAST